MEEEQEVEQPVAQLLMAAEGGDAQAQITLGNYYSENGNHVEAAQWYRKAAVQGDASAQFSFGVCCLNGLGVPKDEKQAMEWFLMAANGYNADAQFNMGIFLLREESTHKQAAQWFSKAAKKGHMEAQYQLAVCYDNGFGFPRDSKRAEQWHRLAAEQGHKRSSVLVGLFPETENGEDR